MTATDGARAAEDAALILGAAAASPASIEALYLRYHDGAIAVAQSVVGDEMEAEDVVQEVFLELPRMARTYDARRGFAPQWLYRSVRNRAIDHVRRRTREAARIAASSERSEAMLAAASSSAPTPAEQAEADEFLEVIGRLDARHAHLIRLAFVDGWSHSAIAGLTGLPLGTVKTRIRLSLKLIRGILGEADITPIGDAGSEVAEARMLLVSDSDAFARSVRRAAAGLARVERAAALPSDPREAPAAVIVSSAVPPAATLDRLRELGWGSVPVALRTAVGQPRTAAEHDAAVVMTTRTRSGLPPAILVPAILSASHQPTVQRAASRRLLGRSGAAALAADRLGRVTSVSASAATLLGRTPRQLMGMYVTDLSAMSRNWSEHEFHRLVSRGWWSGDLAVSSGAGDAEVVHCTAWMIRGGGLLSVLAPIEG
ncbi:MAG TPA: sigma-70 family RNA polymerase sigma factor [Candidatus Limnocylindria bacterium]|nr:sigma-70 family RNA polymerase sigma factor [Candidatus Limnocylindria bacterium]